MKTIIAAIVLIGLLAGAAWWLDNNGFNRAMAEVQAERDAEKLRVANRLTELEAAKAAMEVKRANEKTTIKSIKADCLDVTLDSIDPRIAGLLDDPGG